MGHLDEMKALPQWVGWTIVVRGGKNVKVPMNPNGGGTASVSDPSTWATAEVAWRAAKRNEWSGIGFVFTSSDPFVGVDLDSCFVDGELTDRAKEIVNALGSYTELSPSRSGLHIICKGNIPGSVNQSVAKGVEMYQDGRYFTVTGKVFVDLPVAERTSELATLYNTVAGQPRRPVEQGSTGWREGIVPVEKIRAALSRVPPYLEYSEWCAMLMAVHSEYPNQTGVSLIEEWSPGYEGEVAKKFSSFKRQAGGKISIGTLFSFAKKFGWDWREDDTAADRVVPGSLDVAVAQFSPTMNLDAWTAELAAHLERGRSLFKKRGWAINEYTVSQYRLGWDPKSNSLIIPALNGESVLNVRTEDAAGDGKTETTFPFFDTMCEDGQLLRFGGHVIVADEWDIATRLYLQTPTLPNTRILGICTEELDPAILVPILRNASKVTTFTNGTGSTPKKLASMSRRVVHNCDLPVSPRVVLESGIQAHSLNRLLQMASPVHPGQGN